MIWFRMLLYLLWPLLLKSRGLFNFQNTSVKGDLSVRNTLDPPLTFSFIHQFLSENSSNMFDNVEDKSRNLKSDAEFDNDKNENIKDGYGYLLKPVENGLNGRSNRVFWTDAELKAENIGHQLFSSNNVSNIDPQVVRDSRIELDTEKNNFRKFAEERQFIVSGGEFSVTDIQEVFKMSVETLPLLIDNAKEIIVEDIAKGNMLGYSVAASYFTGAALDTIATFLIDERFITDVFTNPELIFLLGWLWFYAAGFAGPWLFPSTFSGGDPYLECDSRDYFPVLQESGFDLNLDSINSKSYSEVLIMAERFKVNFNKKLSCITNKRSGFKEANIVNAMFSKILNLIYVQQSLVGAPITPDDGRSLDNELRNIWTSIPSMVEEVHREVTARRAKTAAIYFFVGLLNLLGAISGILLSLAPIDMSQLPAIADVPGVLVESIEELALDGRLGNDFFLGEVVASIGQGLGWGYGYYMTYFLFIEEADPGCGVIDMDDVYSRHQHLAAFEVLLSTQNNPIIIKYLVEEWKRDMDVSLHCLLSTEEGAMLADTLDMFVSLATARADI